jgi:peptidoglycan/LPS O-acetylase OafA/YrhL
VLYRKEIDGLRALAIIPVVLFHAGFNFFSGGYVGVDIFFVISGYLITTIIFEKLEKGVFSFSNFYARRVKRIFPALILVLFSSFVLGWFVLFPDEYKQLGKHIAGASGFVSNFILWGEEGYFDNASETKPLLHLWSLAIEEQFYIVWPLLVWISYKFRLHFLIVITLLITTSFYFNIYLVDHDKISAFYSPLTRFWELLSGSLVAWILMQKSHLLKNNKRVVGIFAPSGLLLILFSYIYLDRYMNFPGFLAIFPVIGTMLIILSSSENWINKTILSSRVFIWFGLISYPLYLWHWPLLSFANIMEGSNPSSLIKIPIVLLSVLLAWGTFKLIEQPIRIKKLSKLQINTSILMMLFIGFLGYNSYSREGYEFRQIGAYFQKLKIDKTDPKCFDYAEKNQSEIFRYCRYNDVGSNETIAIIGDSHAAAAYPGLSKVVEGLGKNTVLMGGGDLHNNRWKISKDILKSIVLKKDIKTVFFSTRGVYHINGTEPYGYSKNPNEMSNHEELSAYDSFFQNTQDSINALASAGKKVYYITENPELNKNPKSCLTRVGFLKLDANKCQPLKQEVLSRQYEYTKRVKKLSNASIINVIDIFCPENQCQVLKDNQLLYSDDDHLSIYGSEFQAENLLKRHLK